MPCCSYAGPEDNKEVGSCIHCSGPVNKDGESTEACSYSRTECEVCGYAPCDLSC